MSGRRGLHPSAVLFVCLFAAQAAILVLSPILPQVADEFGVTTATAAQLRSVSGVTAGILALGIAATGGRYRLTSLLTAGLILVAVSSLASAVAPSFVLLIAAQVVIGIGLAMVLSGGLAASEAWARDGEGARVLSWALVGQPVAWIVGQPVVGLVAAVDWRWAWVAVPLASSLVALVITRLRDRSVSEAGRECDPLGLWRQPGVKRWAVGELLAFSAWAGTLVFAGAFFREVYGVGVGAAGLLLGAGAAAYVPGNFLGRRWLRGGAPRLLVGAAAAAAVLVVMFGAVQPGLAFSAVIFAILAFIAAGRTIAGAAMGLELAAGRRLAAMSVRTAMLQFGYLIGSAAGGAVLADWGYAGIGWLYGALFLAAGAVHLGRERAAAAVRRLDLTRHLRRSGRSPGLSRRPGRSASNP